MNAAWDKFAWITAVGADGRLTAGERFVLMQIALNWTAVDRATYRVRQATIAERLSVSLRLVKSALAQAKRHGYVTVEQPRKRGTGRHIADMNRLGLPTELGANPAPHSTELSAQSAPHSTELGARNDGVGCTDAQSEVHGCTELGPDANAPTSENDVPNCSLKAPDKALEKAPAPASATPPPSRCPKHINDNHPPPCHACGQARLAAEAFELQQAEARKQELREAWENVRNCTTCDGTGLVEVDDNTVEHCQCREGIPVCN